MASPYDAPGAAGGPDLFIKIDQFHEAFCADLSEDIAGPMAVSQRPLAAAAFTEAADGRLAGPSELVPGVRARQRHPARVRTLHGAADERRDRVGGGSHVAFIAQPDVASGLILKALASRMTWARGCRARRALERKTVTWTGGRRHADDRRLRDRGHLCPTRTSWPPTWPGRS